MTLSRYAAFVPTILNWIRLTLATRDGEKLSVASFTFKRLPRYFSSETLNSASVVITNHLPRPPFSLLGLTEFATFETQPMSAITYLDTYFLDPNVSNDESVHFHELAHVVQWQVLGPNNFLLLYAAGLAEFGYLESPLEAMAYDHQRRFDAREPPYSVEEEVSKQTLVLKDWFSPLS